MGEAARLANLFASRSGGGAVSAFGDGAMTHPLPHPTPPSRCAIRLRILPPSRGKGRGSQTIPWLPSQFHSSSGQIATGSPAVFISPKPCPPRSKKWLSHGAPLARVAGSEEHTHELQSLMRI